MSNKQQLTMLRKGTVLLRLGANSETCFTWHNTDDDLQSSNEMYQEVLNTVVMQSDNELATKVTGLVPVLAGKACRPDAVVKECPPTYSSKLPMCSIRPKVK